MFKCFNAVYDEGLVKRNARPTATVPIRLNYVGEDFNPKFREKNSRVDYYQLFIDSVVRLSTTFYDTCDVVSRRRA